MTARCDTPGCGRPARMAVRVTRRGPDLRVTAYADDQLAPAAAIRYCKRDGIATVADLLAVVVDIDEEAKDCG